MTTTTTTKEIYRVAYHVETEEGNYDVCLYTDVYSKEEIEYGDLYDRRYKELPELREEIEEFGKIYHVSHNWDYPYDDMTKEEFEKNYSKEYEIYEGSGNDEDEEEEN